MCLPNGKVNSAGEKMFERIADASLAVPKINQLLGNLRLYHQAGMSQTGT
jgi:hypothetical protein